MTTTIELKKMYGKGKKRKVLAILSVFIALIITALISISIGAASPSSFKQYPLYFQNFSHFYTSIPAQN